MRLDPGAGDKFFNLLDLSAEQVERILGGLSEQERSALGQDTSSSMTLNLVSKLLRDEKLSKQTQQNMRVPEGTTPPPPNG